MYKNKQGGLIKLIIIIIIAVTVLSWYGVDIKNFFTSPLVQKNFGYVWNFIKDIWFNYLVGPAHQLWLIWVDRVWDPLMHLLPKGDQTNITTT